MVSLETLVALAPFPIDFLKLSGLGDLFGERNGAAPLDWLPIKPEFSSFFIFLPFKMLSTTNSRLSEDLIIINTSFL